MNGYYNNQTLAHITNIEVQNKTAFNRILTQFALS